MMTINRKRGKYSRNGCKQCKKMKVKCDELRPKCTRCSKGSRLCHYDPQTTEVDTFIMRSEISTSGLPSPSETACSTALPITQQKPSLHSPSRPHIMQKTSPSSVKSTSSSSLSLNSFLKQNDATTEINFLEQLNNDITMKIEKVMDSIEVYSDLSSQTEREENDQQFLLDDLNLEVLHNLKPYHEQPNPNLTLGLLLTTTNFYQIPLELFFTLKDLSQRRYIEVFFFEYSQILLPLIPEPNLNPVRDILLLYSFRKSYLFYSILACGARFSYKKTLLEEDQYYFSKYMKKALEMLKDLMALKNFRPENKTEAQIAKVSKMVEPLLLTILLLTSDNASSMGQSWRGHLKGAKELLHKVFIQKFFKESVVLIFCKMWFTSFEILAGLAAPVGGTLIQEFEMKSLMFDINPYEIETMKALKLITKDGYNLLFGFHTNLCTPLTKLIESLRVFGKGNDEEKLLMSYSIFDLISELNNNKTNISISQNGSIPKNHPLNPLNKVKQDKTIDNLKIAISSYKNLASKEIVSIFWYDVCHESYLDAALLTCLTKILDVSKDHFAVQILVKNLLSRLYFLNSDYETFTIENAREEHNKLYTLMLLQWPVLVAGTNCISLDDRYKIESFFRLLAQLGSGSARFSLDRIKKSWNNEISSDEVDIVTY